jgi:nickel-type superoxide dismutase maturation protease
LHRGALIWIVLAIAVAAAARRSLDVVEVRGRSMAPTLLPGDRLLVVRMHRAPRAGEVVLAPDPRDPRRELVKRVAGVGSGGVELRGDNVAASTDARIAPDRVRWRAVLRYWPPNRATTRLGRPRALEPVDEGGEAACAVPEALVAGPGAAS